LWIFRVYLSIISTKNINLVYNGWYKFKNYWLSYLDNETLINFNNTIVNILSKRIQNADELRKNN